MQPKGGSYDQTFAGPDRVSCIYGVTRAVLVTTAQNLDRAASIHQDHRWLVIVSGGNPIPLLRSLGRLNRAQVLFDRADLPIRSKVNTG